MGTDSEQSMYVQDYEWMDSIRVLPSFRNQDTAVGAGNPGVSGGSVRQMLLRYFRLSTFLPVFKVSLGGTRCQRKTTCDTRVGGEEGQPAFPGSPRGAVEWGWEPPRLPDYEPAFPEHQLLIKSPLSKPSSITPPPTPSTPHTLADILSPS